MSSEGKEIIKNLSWSTIFIYLLLVLIGWCSIYASVSDETQITSVFDLNRSYGKQLLWIGISLCTALFILIVDPKFFTQTSYIIYGVMLVCLLSVLLTGTVTKGSKSWFMLFNSIKVQPSEFAKFATALALARFLGRTDVNLSDLTTKVKAVAIVLVPLLLVLMQNDTGSSLVFFSFVFVLYREGLSINILFLGFAMILLFVFSILFNPLIVIGCLIGVAIILGILNRKQPKRIIRVVFIALMCSLFVSTVDYVVDNVLGAHQKNRIEVLLGLREDPKGVGYNVNQSKIAIGSGGFFGKGFRKGTQTKYNFVPEQRTDFIFCTIGEERGFLGSSFVVILYVLLLSRLVVMAERCRSATARIYGYGVASILFVHFAINIGMTLGLLPVIGIPLPFVSYGGSSLLAFTILLFVFIRQDAVRNQLI